VIPREEWEWFGAAGHFICGSKCRFHMATAVGPYLVSTLGEYLPDSNVRDILAESRGIVLEGKGDYREASWMEQAGFEQIGAGRTYETMVFKATQRCDSPECGCGMPRPDDHMELDAQGYNHPGEATRGHYAMCEKWAELAAIEQALEA
jgi:hypothetical protein